MFKFLLSSCRQKVSETVLLIKYYYGLLKGMRLDHQEVASLLSSIRLRIHDIVENIFQEYDKLNRRSENTMYSRKLLKKNFLIKNKFFHANSLDAGIKLQLYRDSDSHHNIPGLYKIEELTYKTDICQTYTTP
jgi:hypothetical protein